MYGTICRTDAPVLQHLKRFLRFIQPEDMRPEREKDIWALKKLDIPIKENPIYKTETLDFTGILQEGLREEVCLLYTSSFGLDGMLNPKEKEEDPDGAASG